MQAVPSPANLDRGSTNLKGVRRAGSVTLQLTLHLHLHSTLIRDLFFICDFRDHPREVFFVCELVVPGFSLTNGSCSGLLPSVFQL
jgi:hypothetical protein